MDQLQIEAKIASNLISLAIDEGVPSPFCHADVTETLASDSDPATKLNQLRKIKAAVHEVLYAPPRG